jgi:PleD family two-component response regulator
MPHTDLPHGIAAAERFRAALADTRIEPLAEGITASFGVAELAVGEQGTDFMRRIDKALYEAKRNGRNRVVAA